jgi:hypothetical protein
MKFIVERAVDPAGHEWVEIGVSGDHKGDDPDAYAVEEIANESGFYRARPVEAPESAPAFFNVDANGVHRREP